MNANLINLSQRQFTLAGVCPHCARDSVFLLVTSVHNIANVQWIAGMQCQGCLNFILAIVRYQAGTNQLFYEEHYPLGKPDDAVPSEVTQAAKGVAEDFSEALRCHWVKAYRASVVMCRRAIQSTAIQLKAKGGRLIDQIDDLFSSGKITEALKEYAHEVRLTGNDGAHPDKDALADVEEKDSADIIVFTREFLNHIFVIPARFKARKNLTNPPVV